MLYLQRTFTLPASWNTSQMRWDFAVLTPEEFQNIYKITEEEYKRLEKEGID